MNIEISKEDLEILIKMENLIGVNEKKLFGRNKNKKCVVKWFDDDDTIITYDDFISYMNIIENIVRKVGK